jgi:hypothetical protein
MQNAELLIVKAGGTYSYHTSSGLIENSALYSLFGKFYGVTKRR